MIRRPTIDEYFMIMAMHASSRGSCIRRRVGCVLTDVNNHVLATGYNGPPAGATNCTSKPCAGAKYPSGQGLHLCEATHAEDNALRQCPNIFKIKTAYVTATPCTNCMDMILKTSCERIVYLQAYASSHSGAIDKWLGNGRQIEQLIVDEQSPVHIFTNIYGF